MNQFGLKKPRLWIMILSPMVLVVLFGCSHVQKATGGKIPSRGTSSAQVWRFAVSGDSRNCGDLVMPAIAKGVLGSDAKFYWHLGDFRHNAKIDEDIAQAPEYRAHEVTPAFYKSVAWDDFIRNQLKPFGTLPLYLAIGNHELYGRTREEYVLTFHDWLTAPSIQRARSADGEDPAVAHAYFHWTLKGVDFITLDNATGDQFDAAQMEWFRKVLARDLADSEIKTIVLGMHEALPDSISFGHSMSESKDPTAVISGREVYQAMLKARDKFHKNVYILASHSHFFMEGIFNTPYWKEHGGVLPGWIVGTAGAERLPLPEAKVDAVKSLEKVYGYLLATVDSENGSIAFDFQLLQKADIASAIGKKYEGTDLLDFCVQKNTRAEKLK